VRVPLAYGRHGTTVEVPEGAQVVVPVDAPGFDDEGAAIADALRHPVAGPPLGARLQRARRVAVVFPDLTRPMPNRTVLPPLLAELARAGVSDDRITLLCATGTHRLATAAEMAELVGADIVARYTVVDHDATSDAHVPVGEVDGTPVLLQREYVEADVRIVTGFVEPHFFAGFSGGPKGVCPGLAATETILEAHHPRRIADARATFVTRAGNPVHDFVRAATALAPPDLSLDVAINRARRVTAVFAGPLPDAHDAACAHVEASAVRSTATSTRPSRAWPPPSESCATAGSSSWPPPARTACPPAARSLVSSRTPRLRPSSPGQPGAPSSTAGRPRYWAGSSPGPRCTFTVRGSRRVRSRTPCSCRPLISTAPWRRPWTAWVRGRGWR
jgi:hypothetical protein